MAETTVKFTPGPWRFSESHGGRWYVYGADNNPIIVPNGFDTSRWRSKDEIRGNDLLIAAAPELLVAVRQLLEHVMTDSPSTTRLCAIGDAEAAIAKAEGRNA